MLNRVGRRVFMNDLCFVVFIKFLNGVFFMTANTLTVGLQLFSPLPQSSTTSVTVTVTPLSTVYRPVGSHCNSLNLRKSSPLLSPKCYYGQMRLFLLRTQLLFALLLFCCNMFKARIAQSELSIVFHVIGYLLV